MATDRVFSGSGFDMLTAASTVVEHAIDNKEFLIQKRVQWADPYFADLKLRISNDFTSCLGIDPKKLLRSATATLTRVQEDALTDLSDFQVQLKEDFKSDELLKNELLTSLGFTSWFSKAKRKNQAALINLLLKFKSTLDGTARDVLLDAGYSAELLDKICGYANVLNEANTSQETLKGSSKEPTEEAVKELNAVYREVIGLAKIARRFFIKDKVKAELFNFKKIMKQQHSNGHSRDEKDEANPDQVLT